ncbi:MAG: UbiA family prenyltransferase [Cyclobacteriaceae bacterium]
MLTKSTWLHLRIPFSYFLMPVYFFALAISPNFTEPRLIWSFLIIHLLLYPASNGFNSYFDKDEKSIGGLKNPPPVNVGLYYTSLLFDVVALILALKISALFSGMLFVYGLVSKAYSHPSVRLKKYPIVGWLVIGLFQGFFAFLMCYVGINGFELTNLAKTSVLLPAGLTSVMLWASYPLTQVYQHEQDAKSGDHTISMKLGIRGTFYFCATVFTLAAIAFFSYFATYHSIKYGWAFIAILSPVVLYFLIWLVRVLKDEKMANFGGTMWMNFVSATCLNIFFIYFFLDTSQVIQAIKGGF